MPTTTTPCGGGTWRTARRATSASCSRLPALASTTRPPVTATATTATSASRRRTVRTAGPRSSASSAMPPRQMTSAGAHDDDAMRPAVADGDGAGLDDGERAVAAVGGQPLRAAHRGDAVAPVRAEPAAVVSPPQPTHRAPPGAGGTGDRSARAAGAAACEAAAAQVEVGHAPAALRDLEQAGGEDTALDVPGGVERAGEAHGAAARVDERADRERRALPEPLEAATVRAPHADRAAHRVDEDLAAQLRHGRAAAAAARAGTGSGRPEADDAAGERSVGQPQRPVRSRREPPRAHGARKHELRDAALRVDAADRRRGVLGEPQGAVGAAHDPGGLGVRRQSGAEPAERALRRDPQDLSGVVVGEPEV